MASESLDTFLHRAEDFSRGMGLLQDDDMFVQSAALLAIHATIAYSDALRVGLGGSSLSSEDHQTAATSLERLLPKVNRSGINRLRNLLGSKNDVAYGIRKVQAQRLRLICIDSQRFALWANSIGNEKIAGWRSTNDG